MTTTAADLSREPATRAVRSPLRSTALLVLEFCVLAIPFNVAYGYAMGIVYRATPLTGLSFAILTAAVLCNAYWLWARFVVRRTPTELTPVDGAGLGLGVLLGAVLMCTVVAVIAIAGDLHLSAGSGPALAGLPGVALLAGVAEELIARGIVLRNLENVFGSIFAIAATAVLFGCLHFGNPHATPLSTIAIGIEGGAMLAAVYVATRSLWWTIGVHAAWNFTQTSVFGIADSGHPGRGFLQSQLDGPAWLTGGVFGVEASLVSVVLCAAVAIFFLLRAHRDGRFVAPIWSSRR